MRIIHIRTLEGPNLFANFSVLRLRLDLQSLADTSSATLPGLTDRLVAALPGLIEHRCSRGHRGGFVERLREGTYFAHIVEHVALEMSGPAGIEVGFGKTVYAGKHGVYDIAVEFEDDPAMRLLLEAAVEFCEALSKEQPYDLAPALERAKELAHARRLGPSTQAIVAAAKRRGIPWSRLNDQSLIVLGYGKQRRYIQATTTSNTRFIAVELAGDKQLTKQLLERAGLPVPQGRIVRSEEDAVAAFHELTPPVVVKPLDGNQGRGVSLRLESEAQVREAFRIAREHRSQVLVECFIEGRNFRVIVVGGRMVAAAERFPAHVVGDGQLTVAELIELENQNPLRDDGHRGVLSRIEIDDVVRAYLAKTNRSLADVPEAGEAFYLRESINLSTGGTACDVTDQVHPEAADACERAARAIELDVCGIDLVCRDINRPLLGQGAIIELNAAPGIRMHEHPSRGRARDVGGAIIDSLYPNGSSARVPILSITGTNGKTTVTRMIGHVLAQTGKRVGMTTTEGVHIGGVCVQRGDTTGPHSARSVLFDPTVEVAVLETARGGIVRRGLGYDWSDIGVITNIQPDHLGQDGIDTIDELFDVKKIVAERVREGGTLVLNAEDPRLALLPKDRRIARLQRNIVFFALQPNNPALVAHVKAGGVAYTIIEDTIVELSPESCRGVVSVRNIPATLSGRARFAVDNALAATAACRAHGCSRQSVARGLETFDSHKHNPGRLNLYRVGHGFMIVDYGHNLGAYAAACELAKSFRHRCTTAVVSVPGDRPDTLITAVGRTVAHGFDRIVLKDDQNRRGRKRLEIPALLADAIRSERPEADCLVLDDEERAVRHALSTQVTGELLFVFTDRGEHICRIVEELGGSAALDLDELAEVDGVRLAG
jgi:cyanophycin synthetase